MIILYTIFTFCTIIFLKFINLYLFSQYHLLFHQFCVILLLTLLLIVKDFSCSKKASMCIILYHWLVCLRFCADFFLFFYCQRKEDFLTCRTPELLYLELFLLLMILLKNSIICSASIVLISLDEWEVPYREKNISIISVALDAPNDIISSLSGKIGMLPGVSSKTIYTKS